MKTTNRYEILYAIAIHGYAPEFWPDMAFRRKGQFDIPEKQKKIKCPYCGKLFMTICMSRKLELYRYPKKAKIICHEYRKCRVCYEMIGVIYQAG